MTIHTGDCIEVMASLEPDSVDAVVTDPPYGLEFMGKAWDQFKTGRGAKYKQGGEFVHTDFKNLGSLPTYVSRPALRCITCGKQKWSGSPCKCEKPEWREDNSPLHAFQAWCEAWGREALRVTRPGGYLLAFGGTRTHHRLVCGLEDAGWIIRDELDWIYACLSDDTELLTREYGWVPYNRATEGNHAAAFDPWTGELRWEPIEAVHQYQHTGPLADVGPSRVTLNHRVILDAQTARVPRLSSLWGDIPEAMGVGQAHGRAVLFEEVQWHAAHPRSSVSTGQGVERGTSTTTVREDDGLPESRLEGRRYRVQEAWELFGSAVRSSAGMGEADGPQGWVRDGASVEDRCALRLLAHADRMREPREPRPDRQPPRESNAMAGQPDPQAVRVGQGDRGDGLPSGDHPRLVDYAGVVWCITVPSGAFVARRNGVAFVTGNSGFPKGKANLKPAHEPIVLARKPGPLRPLAIDACRIPSGEELIATHHGTGHGGPAAYISTGSEPYQPGDQRMEITAGRWPSNLLLSEPALFDEPNAEVVGSGATDAGGGYGVRGASSHIYGGGDGFTEATGEVVGYGDSGGYSRFFKVPSQIHVKHDDWWCECGMKLDDDEQCPAANNYPKAFIVPKADRGDREPVLRGQLTEAVVNITEGHGRGPVNTSKKSDDGIRINNPRENAHPTVKPTDLMRHLVRLVTPQGGTVLDCFLGSGSTAIAAELEGFAWIGIEKEPEYVAIAEARLNGTQRGLGLDVPAPSRPQQKPGRPLGRSLGAPEGRTPHNVEGWGFKSGTPPDEEPAA